MFLPITPISIDIRTTPIYFIIYTNSFNIKLVYLPTFEFFIFLILDIIVKISRIDAKINPIIIGENFNTPTKKANKK